MIPNHLLQRLQQHTASGNDLWVGYSGGLDSTVLLHIAVKTFGPQRVKAVHVNHGLSPNADSWQSHCQEQCVNLGVECVNQRVVVQRGHKGIENAARKARYKVFQNTLQHSAVLLLGHHQDDQAETLLFRLIRGAGLKGLAGIPEQRCLSNGASLLRPLLSVSKARLEVYAKEHGLVWIEDESNTDESFDRNYFRQRVMPNIENKWTRAISKMAESASLLSNQQSLLNEYLDQDLVLLNRQKARLGEHIDLEEFRSFTETRKKSVIQRWAEINGLDTPNKAHLAQLNDVIDAQEDAAPCLNWGNAEVRRFRAKLYLLPKCDLTPLESKIWDPAEALNLGKGGLLRCLNSGELNLSAPLKVRSRINSERCRPQGRLHSQTIKKLLQEYDLEPWLRDVVPCMYYLDELVAVGDIWVCDTKQSSVTLKLHWSFEGIV